MPNPNFPPGMFCTRFLALFDFFLETISISDANRLGGMWLVPLTKGQVCTFAVKPFTL